jgi:alpha-glucosidase
LKRFVLWNQCGPLRALGVVLASLGCAACASRAREHADQEGYPWWQRAVFYEIYPRSFADSNGDGIGDLNGITSRLDYLRWLGVDAIWLTPIFPSPQVDFGYDVSDYEDVNPEYGTRADLDRLIAEAKERNIRVILDFVMNHTSNQHPWFQESRTSRTNPKRTWYVWRDGRSPGQPPNNWISGFGGPAWSFDAGTGQWYYHYFYPEQPDLNWRNPALEKAMFDVTRWWYRRGVAGFRLDAVNTLFEDRDLRNNPVVDNEKTVYGDPLEIPRYNRRLPEVHGVLRRLRQVADQWGAVLIGETWTNDIRELQAYYGVHGNELHLPMNLMFATVNRLSAPEFRRQIAAAEMTGGWPVYLLSNHDMRRAYERYGDGQHNDQIAKLMAVLYLTLRGTPILYYGEEIGMENNDPKRVEDVRDPIGRLGWPKQKGRDGERTPMQWNASENAGFSKTAPWNPVGPRFRRYNVRTEREDPDSILNVYHRLVALRRTNAVLIGGDYVPINRCDPDVLSYLRRHKETVLLVALNMSAHTRTVPVPMQSATPLLASPGSKVEESGELKIAPFGFILAKQADRNVKQRSSKVTK